MKPQFRDLLKHSGVYGLGQVVSRLASILLLPVHTRFLSPADYGVIAILDLTASVLTTFVSGGVGAALNRYHFDATSREQEDSVWWTGLAVIVVIATIIVLPGFVFRRALAAFTLGSEEANGGFFYGLILWTIWFGVFSQVPTFYLRARKRSWLIVGLSLGSLFLNIGINVYLLAVRHLGIAGVLWGNLSTLVLMSVVRVALLARDCGRFRFDWPLAKALFRFGWPIVLTLLLATVMHQADRYLLRYFVSLEQVGIYSLAYSMGQGLNSLCLVPFSTIWSVVLYDIAREPNFKEVFGRVFEYFVTGLLLFLLGVSLFVRPLLGVFATPEYAGAARLVPIVCLSFVFFSVDDHFRVPALLAKRTISLIPANAIGAISNIVLNLLFVPLFGAVAAAWVSVATYGIFAGVDLMLCRRIDRFDYPLVKCAGVTVAMVLSFAACQFVQTGRTGLAWEFIPPTVTWTVWAAIILLPMVREYREYARLHPGSLAAAQ